MNDQDIECPRCAGQDTELLASSPVQGSWTVMICRCSWRSTEPLVNSSRAHYPAQFRLTEADINAAQDVPPMPEAKART
jgi:vanillate/4-hydroxybenzoate decarboxylase subunit D